MSDNYLQQVAKIGDLVRITRSFDGDGADEELIKGTIGRVRAVEVSLAGWGGPAELNVVYAVLWETEAGKDLMVCHHQFLEELSALEQLAGVSED